MHCRKVEIPFFWVIVKPHLVAPDPISKEPKCIPMDRVQDVDPSFGIEPETGILPSGGETEFILTFAPQKVNTIGVFCEK